VKKVIFVEKFEERRKSPDIKDALIIAFKQKGNIHLQNLEIPDNAKITLEDDVLVLRVPLNDNQFVAIGSTKGIAVQHVIKRS